MLRTRSSWFRKTAGPALQRVLPSYMQVQRRESGNRYVKAVERAREREIHLERLAKIEHRSGRPSKQPVAGGGPPRPWREPPAQMPCTAAGARAAPCASGAPPAARAPRARSAAQPKTFEQREHLRHVQALYSKLQSVAAGHEWRRKQHQELAIDSGRAQHTTAPARRRAQRAVADSNVDYFRNLRAQSARFASPSAIALLTGKPMPGSGGGSVGGVSSEASGLE